MTKDVLSGESSNAIAQKCTSMGEKWGKDYNLKTLIIFVLSIPSIYKRNKPYTGSERHCKQLALKDVNKKKRGFNGFVPGFFSGIILAASVLK